MKNFDLKALTENMQQRNMKTERTALVEKWSKTGLLRGLDGLRRESMAQLLENQCMQLLRESVGISGGAAGLSNSGQLAGFTTIAFPIVRRVFGALVANELVSIQPLNLPQGLVFYLDYTYGSNVGGDAGLTLLNGSTNETYSRGQSIFNSPAGRGVQSGSLAVGGMYDLVGAGYSRVHRQAATVFVAPGDIGAFIGANEAWSSGSIVTAGTQFTGTVARLCGFDGKLETDLTANTLDFTFMHVRAAEITGTMLGADMLSPEQLAVTAFGFGNGGVVAWGEQYQAGGGVLNLRRLNKRGNWDGTTFTPSPLNGTHVQCVLRVTNGGVTPPLGVGAAAANNTMSMVISDALSVDGGTGSALTVPSFESDFGATPSPAIPEIDMKIEQISIGTTTRKLRARWSPELAQDMNAYLSLDAEVELTQILSQQISLEIDREILLDLLSQASGANYYWSRSPGKFVNKVTGATANLASSLSPGPNFTGTVREWYEVLVETIIDVANEIHQKTLRGAANFVVCGPDVSTMFESTVLYRPKLSIDSDGQVGVPFSLGTDPIGTLTNRFTVYKDPYFPRAKILIGYKGSHYLETGYVYAPYIPLIVTPTLFAPEDFTPRKGVMTRYGKKMVRSDFYGSVSVMDMNII